MPLRVHFSALIILTVSFGVFSQQDARKQNILLLIVDDLRPALGCYGDPNAITKNIDNLANGGVLFNNVHCQEAICTPSRVSMLTGVRPETSGVLTLNGEFREKNPSLIPFTQLLKENDHQTIKLGKIFHVRDPLSWDVIGPVMPNKPAWPGYIDSTNIALAKMHKFGYPTEAIDVPDSAYKDGWYAEEASRIISSLNKESPFFLSIGFHKPHLPYIAPKKYWDMYNSETLSDPFPAQEPLGINEFSFSNLELNSYYGVPDNGIYSDSLTKILRHGYYASISYIDEQVGKIVKSLKESHLYDNTIIILWGDHGYKIGEYNRWVKHSNFEIDTRVPLIISTPKQRNMNNSRVVTEIIESIDIYPTICELLEIDKPSQIEGSSFIDALHSNSFESKGYALSIYPRPNGIRGYTIRVKNFRYTKWVIKSNEQILYEEFYDHSVNSFESENIIENIKPTVRKTLNDLINAAIANDSLHVNGLMSQLDTMTLAIDKPSGEFQVYPNPSGGIIYFQETVKHVTVYSQNGKSIYENFNTKSVNTELIDEKAIILRIVTGKDKIIVRKILLK